MPLRSTGSSRPTATASSADLRNDDAIGSSVKVKFDHAPVMVSSAKGLPVNDSIPALTVACEPPDRR